MGNLLFFLQFEWCSHRIFLAPPYNNAISEKGYRSCINIYGVFGCNRQVELNSFQQIILNSFHQLRFNSLIIPAIKAGE
ncbi:hypothetical protein BALCAV_0221840 [Alkalihalobacillus alcalophilus ATCC 27647 = CGMCC 1.3604]|uniref:Uncharacterized protein n=1 Tax=Alkalihalobacillus alcalophilus ATCC 27647 = CGMCC 1.3604 TaxID=1218173 RepID=A0A094WI22_ALKAL|nr:hypothetical protein BALCAV_0221840 [Alkalihalobacillus alcalophilus ATCC 27647 = CGMCC 1.3604]